MASVTGNIKKGVASESNLSYGGIKGMVRGSPKGLGFLVPFIFLGPRIFMTNLLEIWPVIARELTNCIDQQLQHPQAKKLVGQKHQSVFTYLNSKPDILPGHSASYHRVLCLDMAYAQELVWLQMSHVTRMGCWGYVSFAYMSLFLAKL